MKAKYRYFMLLTSLAALGVYGFLRKVPKALLEENYSKIPALMPTTSESEIKAQVQALHYQARRKKRVEENVQIRQEQGDYRTWIAKANMRSVIGMEDLVQKLRAADEDTVASFFETELKRIGTSNPGERGRLTFAANALQSDAMGVFWQDILNRETPAFAGEVQILQAPDLGVDSRFLLNELSMAVRNLGLIASRRPESLALLRKIIEKPNPDFHSVELREEAFTMIRENDLVEATQIALNLDKEDTLKERLNAHSK
ncbi:MAG: hypothetical protein H7249_17845 [Chitinophagaceae bacterium]|nr:hypothetical protein [Oligoflexus sp.]